MKSIVLFIFLLTGCMPGLRGPDAVESAYVLDHDIVVPSIR